MSKNALITTGIVLLVLIAGGWFYYQSQNSLTPSVTTPSSQVSEPQQSPISEATQGGQDQAAREVMVDGTEYKFTPNMLSVKSGEKIKLAFTNKGKLPHNVTIDGLGVVTKTIGAGQSDIIEFTVSKTGNFKMYCSVGNHEALGMRGEVKAD